jgi:hypothetical protein
MFDTGRSRSKRGSGWPSQLCRVRVIRVRAGMVGRAHLVAVESLLGAVVRGILAQLLLVLLVLAVARVRVGRVGGRRVEVLDVQHPARGREGEREEIGLASG